MGFVLIFRIVPLKHWQIGGLWLGRPCQALPEQFRIKVTKKYSSHREVPTMMGSFQHWYLVGGLLIFLMHAEPSRGAAFDINELPLGKNVTLLKPATTIVPIATRTTLGATDLPQILKFEAIGDGGNQVAAIRMAIYDSSQARVRYIDIKRGVPFLYTFRDLDSILVIPQTPGGSSSSSIKLQIESDKPLSIGR
jgi:hypothetical protein